LLDLGVKTGIVEKFAQPTLPRRWTTPLGPGYTGPTVATGRVYVMDRQLQPREQERIVCVAEETGKPLWTVAYPVNYGKIGYQAGPRAAVTVHDGAAYALGATGWLHACAAESGDILWKHDCEREFEIDMPIWGVAGSPLVVGDLVVVHIGGKEACVVAFDRRTGDKKWQALNDRGQYSSPIVIEQGGVSVVVCWTGDSVAGLRADDGQVLWRQEWRPRNMPIGCASPVLAKNRLFLTSFYDGSLMLNLGTDAPTAEKAWQIVGRNERETDALHSIISTPVFDGAHIYGVDSYGELRCLDAANGQRLWENLTATPKSRWSTIHFVRQGERYFLFNERGELLIGKLSPAGFSEISRSQLLEPTQDQLRQRGGVCWSHPAFANRHVFARNDKELVCASLAAE
jgi:outer membrane protein assembly factor BamB